MSGSGLPERFVSSVWLCMLDKATWFPLPLSQCICSLSRYQPRFIHQDPTGVLSLSCGTNVNRNSGCPCAPSSLQLRSALPSSRVWFGSTTHRLHHILQSAPTTPNPPPAPFLLLPPPPLVIFSHTVYNKPSSTLLLSEYVYCISDLKLSSLENIGCAILLGPTDAEYTLTIVLVCC